MSAPGKQRLIDGPEDDVLDETAVCRYLKIESHTLKRMVARGEFPEPLRISGSKRWTWRDVTAYLLWQEVVHRVRAGDGGVTNPGQSVTNPGQSVTTRKRPPAGD